MVITYKVLTFFLGGIDLIYLTVRTNFVRWISIIANAAMLSFLIVLCVVLPEIQVLVLTGIISLTLVVTAMTSLGNGDTKETVVKVKEFRS